MDLENARVSRGESTKSSKPPKDRWDKAEIIFKFLAAAVVVLFGFLGNHYLQEKQKIDSGIKLYTQLLSNKETAENTLRKDMFGQILESFLKPKDGGEQESLRIIREMRLNLELLSRNFHESLDMKPLFKHLLMEIIRPQNELRACSGKLGELIKNLNDPEWKEQDRDHWDGLRKDIEKAKETCKTALGQRKNEEIEFDLITFQKEDKLQENIEKWRKQVDRLLVVYNRELDLLVQTAKRVTRKEREVLEEVADKLELEIPLEDQEPDKLCAAYSPLDWLPREAGTCEIKNDEHDAGPSKIEIVEVKAALKEGIRKFKDVQVPGPSDAGPPEIKTVQVKGVSNEATLMFKDVDGKYDETSKRYFRMLVRYIYPSWKRVFVEVLSCPEKEGCEERKEDDPEKDVADFWLEYFDFPLVDNTYLNEDQRYSVILEGFKEDEKGHDVKAKVTLLYYPAAYAGLKEKSFYNNQLMRGLLDSELFDKRPRIFSR